MGKIFDALEKSYKKVESKGPISSVSANNVRIDGEQNVLPLNAFKDPMAGNQSLDKNIIAYYAPQSLEAEAIKVLRTNILFPPNGTKAKSILVTSAIPGEGKSFLSANLAVSIARGVEEHVLLIDTDIRKSSIDKIFGIKQNRGLSEYLALDKDIADYFYKTPIQKLTILPAGKLPSNPTELLTTQKMRRFLKEVAERYNDRYVILDSAPPSMASETIALSKYVDGVILVVRAGKTPRNVITEVIEQLGQERILGIVFNYADQAIKKYYGYGKSYYNPKSK